MGASSTTLKDFQQRLVLVIIKLFDTKSTKDTVVTVGRNNSDLTPVDLKDFCKFPQETRHQRK